MATERDSTSSKARHTIAAPPDAIGSSSWYRSARRRSPPGHVWPSRLLPLFDGASSTTCSDGPTPIWVGALEKSGSCGLPPPALGSSSMLACVSAARQGRHRILRRAVGVVKCSRGSMRWVTTVGAWSFTSTSRKSPST